MKRTDGIDWKEMAAGIEQATRDIMNPEAKASLATGIKEATKQIMTPEAPLAAAEAPAELSQSDL